MSDEDEYPVETPVAPPAPAEPTSKFGWCMTNQHEQCRKTEGRQVCHCTDCGDRHGIAPTVFEPLSDSTLEIMERYRIK